MSMNLDTLIDALEKSAEKQPAPKGAEDKILVSQELEAVLTKEAAATNASRAFQDGEKLAADILEKLASEAVLQAQESTEQVTEGTPVTESQEKVAQEVTAQADQSADLTTEENMNKEAQDAGKELATMILEKLAEGVVVQENSATAAPPANKLQQKDQELVAQHDQRVTPVPGRNGTISQMFDAIVAKAKARSNAVAYDQVGAGDTQGAHEGGDVALGTGAQGPSPEVIDKTAAVNALIEAGIEWEDAVDLVKAAAYEIEQEELGQVKLAAVGELMNQGLDFDSAVEAVQAVTTEEVSQGE